MDEEDLRGLPLLQSERRLHELMPFVATPLRCVDHLGMRGVHPFSAVCRADAAGNVGQSSTGVYDGDGLTTSW